MPWYTEDWSRGILMGLVPDANTGYRATIWFEYTRALFNQIREGSLIAVRNFSDHPPQQPGELSGQRDPTYEEYSILQIDQVHPWHYAIQGAGDQGYPAFNVAAAESARSDWTAWDLQNRDDVTRIRCEAIPLRLAFTRSQSHDRLPSPFSDRSKPMPGHEARLLRPEMTQNIVNQGLDLQRCVALGSHLVQPEVTVQISVPELLSLHFGVFGFTGAGKSNLVSTLVRRCLDKQPSQDGRNVFKIVLFDLMDEYTGLLIDQLVQHHYSRLIICGREAVDTNLLRACEAMAHNPNLQATRDLINEASRSWAQRITLPAELRALRQQYIGPLAQLIRDGKMVFYEPLGQQGQIFNIDLNTLLGNVGAQTFGSRDQTQNRLTQLRQYLEPLMERARNTQGTARDQILRQMVQEIETYITAATTGAGRQAIERLRDAIRGQMGSRGALERQISTYPQQVVRYLNYQPEPDRGQYQPSLTIVIGENEEAITRFAKGEPERANGLINETFNDRRNRSLLHPIVSFIFDEADVFMSQERGEPGNITDQGRLLARRGRKFGLGLGIATQRIIYLDTSIMAQPHTYFISKLPRESDRRRIADAFAISEESLEQSFSFTPGQWLVASHDATGLKGTPFPVQLPNANDAVRVWLNEFNASRGR